MGYHPDKPTHKETEMPPIRAFAAAFAGALSMWIIAGVWHEVAAAWLYADRIDGQHQGIGIILAAYGLLALLMTFFLRHTRLSAHPLLNGLIIGAVIGVLWVFPRELSLAAAHGEPLGYAFVNALWHMVEQGLGGVIIALVMSRMPMRSASA
jgi:hypothetical protein